MENRADRTRPEPELNSWKEYFRWHDSLSRDEALKGRMEGVWPEGTPPIYIEIEKRLTPEEQLIGSISRVSPRPSFEEVLARPEDYLVKQGEKHQHLVNGLMEDLKRKLSPLNEEERRAFNLRFGLEDGRARTQAEVAQELGCSVRTVRRKLKSAFTMLRLINYWATD